MYTINLFLTNLLIFQIMGDSDEDVVLEGSALHHHLVSSGYTDMVVQEKGKCQQPSLAAELEGLSGDSHDTDQPRNHMKK